MKIPRGPADFTPAVVRKLADKGQAIEAGWRSFAEEMIDDEASPEQLDDLRAIFYLGAYHLLNCVIALNQGTHTTRLVNGISVVEADEKDFERMAALQEELRKVLRVSK